MSGKAAAQYLSEPRTSHKSLPAARPLAYGKPFFGGGGGWCFVAPAPSKTADTGRIARSAESSRAIGKVMALYDIDARVAEELQQEMHACTQPADGSYRAASAQKLRLRCSGPELGQCERRRTRSKRCMRSCTTMATQLSVVLTWRLAEAQAGVCPTRDSASAASGIVLLQRYLRP